MTARLLAPVETFSGTIPAGTVLVVLAEYGERVTLGDGTRVVICDLAVERVEVIA